LISSKCVVYETVTAIDKLAERILDPVAGTKTLESQS